MQASRLQLIQKCPLLPGCCRSAAERQFSHYNDRKSSAGRTIKVNSSLGNWLVLVGIVIVVIGLVAKTGLLGWLGHLPGDIVIKREGFRFYFPITSMVLVSILLSLLFALIRRF